MANVLKNAAEWIASSLLAHASVSVVYSRGATSVTVSATAGAQPLRVSGPNQSVNVEWANRDYCIRAADLEAGGISGDPQPGDRIRETEGGTTYVYEVMAPKGEPVWRWADGFRILRRIHSKQVGTE